MRWHCETCETIADCKKAFGRYWTDKSHGGVGCDYRFRYRPGGLAEHSSAIEAGSGTAGRGSAIRTESKKDTVKQGRLI